MSPQEMQQLKDLLDKFYRIHQIDKDVFQHPVFLRGGVAFFDAPTPVGKQPAIADPSGGATVDAQARASIVLILALFRALNLTK